MNEALNEQREVLELIAELVDIQKRPHKYAKQAESDWMDKQLPKLERLSDNVLWALEKLSESQQPTLSVVEGGKAS